MKLAKMPEKRKKINPASNLKQSGFFRKIYYIIMVVSDRLCHLEYAQFDSCTCVNFIRIIT